MVVWLRILPSLLMAILHLWTTIRKKETLLLLLVLLNFERDDRRIREWVISLTNVPVRNFVSSSRQSEVIVMIDKATLSRNISYTEDFSEQKVLELFYQNRSINKKFYKFESVNSFFFICTAILDSHGIFQRHKASIKYSKIPILRPPL